MANRSALSIVPEARATWQVARAAHKAERGYSTRNAPGTVVIRKDERLRMIRGRLLTCFAALALALGDLAGAQAALHTTKRHVVKPYVCKQWGYAFYVPAGWGSKNTIKARDKCTRNGSSPNFYSKDKRAYIAVTTTIKTTAAAMTLHMLFAAGASDDTITLSDLTIDGAPFRVGIATVPFRGNGKAYFYLRACAEHRHRAYCFYGSAVKDGNYAFGTEAASMETALRSFTFTK